MIKNFGFKAFGAAVVAAAALLISVSAFAANTVEITSASTNSGVTLSDTVAGAPVISKTDLITVNGTISSPSADITLICVGSDVSLSSPIDDSVLKYIDQKTSDSVSGTASITFRVPLSIANGTYAIYMGGTDVDTLDVKYFKIASSGEQYLSGDVDLSGTVDGSDAIWILRYEIGLSVPSEYDIEAGDVDLSGTADGSDAIWILRYEIGLSVPDSVVIDKLRSR